MKPLTLLILCLSFKLMGQNCYTNFNAVFTWGTNTPSGAVMTLYSSGKTVGVAPYPTSVIPFGASQIPNGSTPYIQGQFDTNVTAIVLGPQFDTNNFPLPVGLTNSPTTPVNLPWGNPVFEWYSPNTNSP